MDVDDLLYASYICLFKFKFEKCRQKNCSTRLSMFSQITKKPLFLLKSQPPILKLSILTNKNVHFLSPLYRVLLFNKNIFNNNKIFKNRYKDCWRYIYIKLLKINYLYYI